MNKYYRILEDEFGPKIRKYRSDWDSAGRDGCIPGYPLHLNFEITFGCNLKCGICPHSIPFKEWNYEVDVSKKISFEKYCEIIDEGSENGLCSISLNGNNEPLLKKDIDKYIEYAVSKDILEISMHTNGILLTEELSVKIINSGISSIMFSIDAFSEESYQEIRKSKDYNLVINNILNFIKMRESSNKKLPLIRVSFVKNKVNEHETDDFIKFWEQRADFLEIQIFRNLFVDHPSYQEVDDKYFIEEDNFGRCYDPYKRLSIQNDGVVFPCCSTYGNEVVLGNIYDSSIKEIWNSEKTKKVRKDINSDQCPSGCRKCRLSVSSAKKEREKNEIL